MDIEELLKKYPHVAEWELGIVVKYGHLLNNTGGNPPAELLDDLSNPGEKNMARTNLPRFVLAAAVQSQVILIARLQAEGLLA